MDMQGISPVRTLANIVVSKLQPDEAVRKAPPAVEKGGSKTADNNITKAKQRVKSSTNIAKSTAVPVDFHDGVIETFINEMDFIQRQMKAPPGQEDSPQSLDTLV